MFWMRLNLRYVDLMALFRHRTTILYVFAILVALFAADPHQFRQHLSFAESVGVWLCCGVFLVGVKHISFAASAAASYAMPSLVIYLPVLSAYEFASTMWMAESLCLWLSNGTYNVNLMAAFPYYFVTLTTFETIFVRFILPGMAIGPNATQAQTPDVAQTMPQAALPPEPAMINFANRQLRLDNIHYVTSEEHYVRMVMRNQTLVHRARLADFLDQIEPHHGVQPHRSWWISTNARPAMKTVAGKPLLALHDGTEVPIARARTRDVQDWLDRHSDW